MRPCKSLHGEPFTWNGCKVDPLKLDGTKNLQVLWLPGNVVQYHSMPESALSYETPQCAHCLSHHSVPKAKQTSNDGAYLGMINTQTHMSKKVTFILIFINITWLILVVNLYSWDIKKQDNGCIFMFPVSTPVP